jgi:hypothetical protein
VLKSSRRSPAGREVRILDAYGSPLRQLILDPHQDYQRMP